jgi:hypothetical protein
MENFGIADVDDEDDRVSAEVVLASKKRANNRRITVSLP